MRFKKKHKKLHIEADEVFLDTKNLPNFDTQQLEGRIEKTISKKPIYLFSSFFVLIGIVFIAQLYFVQVSKGQYYKEVSKNNALDKEVVFSPRGVIYDRNEKRLAWNETSTNQNDFFVRKYIEEPGFSHVLGYVNYPKKDKRGYFWRPDYIGADGIEKQYNELLSGVNGAKLIEKKSDGSFISDNILVTPIPGENIHLSIDAEMQKHLFDAVSSVVGISGYEGGGGAVMKLSTGEIMALVSAPEYNSNTITEAKDIDVVENYFVSKRKPLLNRVIAGLYSPGSIIKPFIGMGALTEGVIDKNTKILSAGSISLPNPYNPSRKSIFVDYRPNNGWVNIKEALSVSSNIFFYNVGGGYLGQKGIGIDKIGEYVSKFGIAQKTGIELPGEQDGNIPSISWKEKTFPGDPWRIGDTYNTAIGQYGFQVTPLQMLQGVSIIARTGTLIRPTILKHNDADPLPVPENIGLPSEHFKTIQEGMRLAVTSSLGTAHGALNSNPIVFAAKTGTAQVGAGNQYINTWIIGFFPYKDPQYAFMIMMDKGTNVGSAGAPTAAKYFFDWFATTEEGKKLYERN